MRITALFDSVDEAEFAASALRHAGEGIFDISIRENRTEDNRRSRYAPMGFFTNIGTGNITGSAVPAYLSSVTDNADAASTSSPRIASVDVICRPSAARRVSRILISRGGHELKGG